MALTFGGAAALMFGGRRRLTVGKAAVSDQQAEVGVGQRSTVGSRQLSTFGGSQRLVVGSPMVVQLNGSIWNLSSRSLGVGIWRIIFMSLRALHKFLFFDEKSLQANDSKG